MADTIVQGVQWIIDSSTGVIKGYRQRIGGVDTEFLTFGGSLNEGDVASSAIWEAEGDIVVGTGAATAAVLPIGAEGEVLKVVSGTPGWGTAAGDVATDAIWADAGDLVVGTGAAAAEALPVGSEGQILKVVSGVPAWAADTADQFVEGEEVDLDPDTWANRETSNFTAGKRYYKRITDIGPNGGTVMMRTSTMTEWGFQGPTLVYVAKGTISDPVSTKATTGVFTSGSFTFPAGSLTEATKVTCHALVTSTDVDVVRACFGTAGDTGDNILKEVTLSATADGHIQSYAVFDAINTPTKYTSTQGAGSTTPSDNISERSTQIDFTAAMTVSVGVSTSAGTATLIYFAVYVE